MTSPIDQGEALAALAAQIPPVSALLERLRPLTKPEACIDGTPMVPVSQPLLTAVVITLGQVAATPVQNRGEDDDDLEPSMALMVLDDIARKEGWGGARMRFNTKDVNTIVEAMVAYGIERAATAYEACREDAARVAIEHAAPAHAPQLDYDAACHEIAESIANMGARNG